VPSQNALFITDGDAIRTLDLATLKVVTRAGAVNAPGHADSPGASFSEPEGITYDPADNTLYIADTSNNEIRAMNPTTYAVTTVAGNLSAGFANGTGTGAQLRTPWGITYNPADGLIYIADSGNNAIRVMDPSTNVVATIAGNGAAGSANGLGPAATFNFPGYISYGPSGNYLLVTDTLNDLIRVIQ
jgi:YVTN family beta-propeller protein